jgi:hypothetical protein
VDVGLIERRFEQFGGPRHALLALPEVDDPMRHVLAGDALSPSTTERVADAIAAFVRGS